MPTPFPYFRFLLDSSGGSNNGTVIGGAAIVSVVEADGLLTDVLDGASNGGRIAETVTVNVDGTPYTYTVTGGFMSGPLAGNFTAMVDGIEYYFSSSNGYETGSSSVIGSNVISNPDYIGRIGTTTVGDTNDLDFFNLALTCFLAGTMIRTPLGETAVESLTIGDLIVTADGGAAPVRFIGRQAVATRFADPLTTLPILIKAGALADNVPSRDLYASAGHAMVIGDVLVLACALVNGTSVQRWQAAPEMFTYYHIVLDHHAVIFAEGAATESFQGHADDVFTNRDAYRRLYPHARPIVPMDLPVVKAARQLPPAMRRSLDARAQAIGVVAAKSDAA